MKGGKYLQTGGWRRSMHSRPQTEYGNWNNGVRFSTEHQRGRRVRGISEGTRILGWPYWDATGLEPIRTLQQRGIHTGMEVFMEYTVRHLFKKDGRVVGCFAYNRSDGSFHLFRANQSCWQQEG